MIRQTGQLVAIAGKKGGIESQQRQRDAIVFAATGERIVDCRLEWGEKSKTEIPIKI